MSRAPGRKCFGCCGLTTEFVACSNRSRREKGIPTSISQNRNSNDLHTYRLGRDVPFCKARFSPFLSPRNARSDPACQTESLHAGSEAEQVCHPFDDIVLGCRVVDLNRRQAQARCFFTEDVREHPIAFEQVTEGSFRVGGPGEKSPR